MWSKKKGPYTPKSVLTIQWTASCQEIHVIHPSALLVSTCRKSVGTGFLYSEKETKSIQVTVETAPKSTPHKSLVDRSWKTDPTPTTLCLHNGLTNVFPGADVLLPYIQSIHYSTLPLMSAQISYSRFGLCICHRPFIFLTGKHTRRAHCRRKNPISFYLLSVPAPLCIFLPLPRVYLPEHRWGSTTFC